MSKLNNPLTQYFHEDYPKQYQEPPGVQKEMNVIPDCGENSYIGAGKLKGRKALVTGGDSGIGRRRLSLTQEKERTLRLITCHKSKLMQKK